MIVSHKHRFIFIKTEKTAGTSMEIALSRYCGPDDIITPISPGDEDKRRTLGYRGPQNYRIPLAKYSKRDLLNAAYTRKRLTFYNHASAAYVMKYLDREVWRSYFKFCFERNPWDKVVSMYYWLHKTEPRPTISEYVQSRKANLIKGFGLYTIHSDIVVDEVYRYEELDRAMQEIGARLKLGEAPVLPRAKGGHRKDRRSYRDILSAADRDKIARVYAREIACFGYEW